jgi:hypothetical protein
MQTGKSSTLIYMLEQLVTRNLDDIIRKNRDRCRLALATNEELATLESSVASLSVQDSLTHWQILVIHITQEDGAQVASPRLVGRLEKSGQSWITSNVLSFDSSTGLVQTRSSVYRVIGERVTETDLDLMHICVSLNQ